MKNYWKVSLLNNINHAQRKIIKKINFISLLDNAELVAMIFKANSDKF